MNFRLLPVLCLLLAVLPALGQPTIVSPLPDQPAQEFQGMGCGATFYEGHIVSLAARKKAEAQEQLYDAMFSAFRTDFLHLMIRHDHEPQNDNDDPNLLGFDAKNFAYADKTIAICAAAKKRLPDMKLYATLYTPPAWMKTNNDPSGGGKAKGALKAGMELELAEFCWAFVQNMHQHGQSVHYLSIANEPDWPHTQPSYFQTPEQHAKHFTVVADYFTRMQEKHPEVPAVKFVGPNVLSAVSCAEKYLPPLLNGPNADALHIVGTHDYDRRGDRWATLTKAAHGRPVWCTEWCVNGPDTSPGLVHSAAQFWLAMTEAFNGGANVWMAYDWVYPPRQGGEALIHLDWGKSFQLTKIYHGYHQWCAPLVPGMKVVKVNIKGPAATGISQAGIKSSAFLDPTSKRLVLHVANVQTVPCEIDIQVPPDYVKGAVTAHQTSETQDRASITLQPTSHTLPPHGLLTVEFRPATAK